MYIIVVTFIHGSLEMTVATHDLFHLSLQLFKGKCIPFGAGLSFIIFHFEKCVNFFHCAGGYITLNMFSYLYLYRVIILSHLLNMHCCYFAAHFSFFHIASINGLLFKEYRI